MHSVSPHLVDSRIIDSSVCRTYHFKGEEATQGKLSERKERVHLRSSLLGQRAKGSRWSVPTVSRAGADTSSRSRKPLVGGGSFADRTSQPGSRPWIFDIHSLDAEKQPRWTKTRRHG